VGFYLMQKWTIQIGKRAHSLLSISMVCNLIQWLLYRRKRGEGQLNNTFEIDQKPRPKSRIDCIRYLSGAEEHIFNMHNIASRLRCSKGS